MCLGNLKKHLISLRQPDFTQPKVAESVLIAMEVKGAPSFRITKGYLVGVICYTIC